MTAREANATARREALADPVRTAATLAASPWLADRLALWPDPWEADPMPPGNDPAWKASAAAVHLAQVRIADRLDTRNPEAFRQQAAGWAIEALAALPEEPAARSGRSLLAGALERLPARVERNDRPDPLLPNLILPPRAPRRGKAEALFALQQRSPAARGFLPDLAPGDVDGEAPPARSVPLELWDLAAGQQRTGKRLRGAPLPARIFVETVLDVGRERWDTSALRGVTLPPERFRDFLRRLYPRSWRTWDRRRLPAMLEAFAILEAPETRIGYEVIGPDGKPGGASRRVVQPIDVPRRGRMDDWVRFSVFLPPGAIDGPMIDRPALRLAGTKTAAAWRLVLSLSADWARPGKTRRPVGRKRHWLQRRDWSAYEPIPDSVLVAMAFPQAGDVLSRSGFRSRLKRAREALAWLAAEGFCEVQPHRDGRRIRPGRKWVGWPDPLDP